MIDLYYWPTPNGHKITMFLEEAGLNYAILPVDISAGDQFKPDFLAISPNNRMPAIIDHAPADGGEPISVFESGAILLYLAEKTGQFLPRTSAAARRMEWLFWQMGGLGPMAGQNHHFGNLCAGEDSICDRPLRERDESSLRRARPSARGPGIHRRRTTSIADMAAYPWIVPWKRQQQNLDDFPNLRRWFDMVRERPGRSAPTPKASRSRRPAVTEEGKNILFGQTADRAPAA